MAVLAVIPGNDYARTNYATSLSGLCRDLEVFEYAPDMIRSFWESGGRRLREHRNEELRRTISKMRSEGRLGVVFCCAYDDFLEPATLRLARESGAKTVNYMVDMPVQWYRLLRTAPLYDFLAIAHKDYSEALRSLGPVIVYSPMAASPVQYFAPPLRDPAPTLSFVGGRSPFREAILPRVKAKFPELTVYGNWAVGRRDRLLPGKLAHDVAYYARARLQREGARFLVRSLRNLWDAPHAPLAEEVTSEGPLPFEQMRYIFAHSRVNLGITQSEGRIGDRTAPRWGRGRDFEIPMCGGFYLVQRAPEQELHFVLGREIETWETFDELIDKASYYLAHPELAQAIGLAGQRRAMKDHTWERRFCELFSRMGSQREIRSCAYATGSA